jgi:Tfp pilus assembly protein PilO
VYFIPRNNRFYSAVAHIRPAYRYSLTCVLLALVAYGWIFHVYLPLEGTVNRYRQHIEQQRKCEHDAQQSAGVCKQLRESLASMRHEMQGLQVAKAGDDSSAYMPVQSLIELLSRGGLSLQSCTTEKEIKQDWCTSALLSCECAGSWSNIQRFFQAAAQGHLITCKSMRITKKTQNTCALSCSFDYTTLV